MKKFFGLFLMILILMTSMTAHAASTVNVEGLKAIEAADASKVYISKKEIIPDANTLNFGNPDYLLLTIQNDTDNAVVAMEIYALAYDAAHQQKELGGNALDFSMKQLLPQQFTASGLWIPAHSSKNIGLYCNADSFTGVRIIIASYTLNDGGLGSVKVTNDQATEWINSAYTDRELKIIKFNDSTDYSQVKRVVGETVNIEELRQIEQKDNFPVKVRADRLEIGFGDGYLGGDDALIIHLENNASVSIKNVSIYAIGYDKNLMPVKISDGHITLRNYNIPKLVDKISSFTTRKTSESEKETIISPNTDAELRLSCDAADVVGIRMLVVSYETTDGTEHTNPSAEAWLNSIIESTDKSYELD